MFNVVQMHVGTACSHTALAGMEHVVSIGTGKGGNHGKSEATGAIKKYQSLDILCHNLTKL